MPPAYNILYTAWPGPQVSHWDHKKSERAVRGRGRALKPATQYTVTVVGKAAAPLPRTIDKMKNILVLFGVLDMVTLALNHRQVVSLFTQMNDPHMIAIHLIILGEILMYASLLFSSFFLMKREKMGIWISYAQFPLRLLFMVLSFDLLLTVARLLDIDGINYRVLMSGLVGLEFLRLGITVLVHRKFYLGTRQSMT